MPAIHTVLGPVEPADLGRTLMHEHILCDFYRVSGTLDHLLNDQELAVEELAALSAAGGGALVEMTTSDIGRDPEGLQHIAARSGLHIVMGCGWYRQPFYPAQIDRESVDSLAQQIIDDLTVGVGDSDVRSGIIGEIGVNLDYATAQEERVLRAAARAQRATGAPLSTHASLFPVGLLQLDLLDEEGVDAQRVIIGHCDTYLNEEYHLQILQRGAHVQFDTIGRAHMNPDQRRAEFLVRLLAQGWVEKLLLSSDRCYRSDLHAFGGAGYDVVFGRFFERLRALGVNDGELDQMTIINPSRVLTW